MSITPEGPGRPLTRFLLLVPVVPERGGGLVLGEVKREAFRSQLSDRVLVLHQHWRTVDAKRVGDYGEVSATVDLVAQCRVGRIQLVAAEVTMPVGDAQVVELEERLSDVGERVASALTPPSHQVPWVGRVALVDRDTDVPPGWLGAGTHEVTLQVDDGQPITVHAGWGNSAVLGWPLLGEEQRRQVARGFVDAQALWADMDDISKDAVDNLAHILGGEGRRVQRADVRDRQVQTSDLTARISLQRLARDDVAINTQGLRAFVGRLLLKAWNHHESCGRVERQVEELARLTEQQANRLNRRYQTTVETVLLALALFTLIDITLSVVGAAYSGQVEAAPGGRLGIFEAIRASGGENLVVSALLIIVALAAVLLLRSRR